MAYSHLLQDLTPREAVKDALYRACLGIDTNDRALFDSAYMSDGTFEIEGRDKVEGLVAIHTTFGTVFKLDTTHFMANERVTLAASGIEARLTCSTQAYHYRTGTGVVPNSPRFVSGSLYDVDVVKDQTDGLWKIAKWHIKIIWLEGDPNVMQG